MHFLRNIAVLALIGVLIFAVTLGVSRLDEGGSWLCGPAFLLLLLGLFQPWRWTMKGMKKGMIAGAIIGGFLFCLLAFIIPPFIAIQYLIDQEYLNMLGMLAICALAYFGMLEIIKSGWISKL